MLARNLIDMQRHYKLILYFQMSINQSQFLNHYKYLILTYIYFIFFFLILYDYKW
jgi:hypothetical protein